MNIGYFTFFLSLLLAAVVGGLAGIVLGFKWKKKDDFLKKQDEMAATIMTTDDGAISMIIVNGFIVPHVQFVNMDELLREEGVQDLDDEI